MKLLITSVGRRSYLVKYFKEAMGNKGKLFVANSVYSIAFPEADGTLITPMIYDPEYVPCILEYCKTNSIQSVISVFDIDLLVLAKSRKLFGQNGIKIILADEDKVQICNDKWKAYKFFEENGINFPSTYLSIKDSLNAIGEGELRYPVIVKPRWGMASIGIFTANDEDELRVLYKKCINEINTTYLKYESASTPDAMVLIQEKLFGQEYGFSIINDLQGNYVATIAEKKIAMRAGETDIGETVSPKIFEEIGKILSKEFRHEAILSVDCFVEDGEVYILELNCRISGHYPILHMGGANLPEQIVRWLNNEPTDLSLFKCKEGVYVTKDLVPVVLGNAKELGKVH
jgi:carbamoyl-phosphate synthase large subunit